MSEKEIIRHLEKMRKLDRRDLKLLASLKLKVDAAIDLQRRGHTHGWVQVQKKMDRIDDVMDCEALARGEL